MFLEYFPNNTRVQWTVGVGYECAGLRECQSLLARFPKFYGPGRNGSISNDLAKLSCTSVGVDIP